MDQPEFKQFANTIPTVPSSSPYVRHLDTNYAPTDREVSAIRALLEAPVSQLVSLDEQIDFLVKHREHLSQYINQHSALIAPIRRISDDVLREIFVATLPSAPTLSPTKSPQILMQICRRWRAIARDTPVLWCRIHLYIPWAANPRSCQLAERRGSALQVWIERSKSLPLRLALSDNQAAVATTLLQPHIHRLQSLCQNLDQENNETFLLKDTSVQFPLLKSLVITSQDDVLEALYDSSLSARVPNIEAVTFAGPFHSPFRLHLNWGKITTFHWKPFRANGSLSNEEALRLLQSMPSLQVCRIEQFRTLTATHDGANTLRVIRLPHLRTLHLHQIEGGPMTVDILNHINAPLLNDLSVHFFEPIPLHSSPINFQPIRRLDMGVGTLPSTHIIELLSSLHSVEDLTFKFQSEPNWFFDNNLSEEEKDTRWRSYGFSDSVLKALTPTSDHTACAPRLRTLAVYNPLWLPSSLTTEAFMAFLVERKRHLDVQLTRITLPSPAYVQGLQDALKQWDEADNGPLIQELLFSNDSEEPRPEPFYPLVTLMQLPEEW